MMMNANVGEARLRTRSRTILVEGKIRLSRGVSDSAHALPAEARNFDLSVTVRGVAGTGTKEGKRRREHLR